MDYVGLAGARPARIPSSALQPHARAVRQRRPRRHSSHRSLITIMWLMAPLLAVVLALAGVTLDRAYHGRVLPGVHFSGLPLSGLTELEVKGLLDSHARTFLAAPVVFSWEEREWRPPAAEMGLSLETQRMARQALALGRAGPIPLRWGEELLMVVQSQSLPLAARIDRAQLSAFLGAVALEVDRVPADANLSIRNGQVVAVPAVAGRRVDVPGTLSRVRLPRALDGVQRVEVSVNAASPMVIDDGVREAQALVSKMLSAPLTLRLASQTWTLLPAALGGMIEFKRSSMGDPEHPGSEKLVASLNEAKVAAYVKTLASQFDKPAVDAQLRWTESGVVVTRESAEGVKLDQVAAVKAIIAQADHEHRDVSLTTTVVKPAVTTENAPQLGIKDLVATGSSRFSGSSPDRANNIHVAAGRINGTVIPAGAIFSFLDVLGPITKANGYKEGLTIQGDATVPGIGGGVCQVSTTAFRAAFYAGLPIVERHQHTYRVSYYEQDGSPVGFDAAVYSPGVDLRFRNDTGAALLIQAGADAATSTVTFRLYGTDIGREVKLAASKDNEIKAGPPLPAALDPALPKGVRKQVEWRADGVDAAIRRTVTQSDRPLLSDTFFSRFVPWQEKWVVGSGPTAS